MAAMAAREPPIPPASDGRDKRPESGRGSAGGGGDGSREGEERGGLPIPSRNPLPLSASQEAQVREVFNERVRKLCAEEIKAFADCARERTFSVSFACRALSRRMNGCMQAHATAAEHDRAREQWFAQRAARARDHERRERRRLEQESFLREWWGLAPRDPEEIRRELEKLQRAEKVGGAVRRRNTGAGAGAAVEEEGGGAAAERGGAGEGR
ncbi:cytochrome c oxidase biogenesis protein Cmc1 like-domain-containing protein [Durotheca rogersii]|uniref:cytochrome c oxidase biogenesis protein Cmc1 like-domain-containing protein n=1 Tax=Durotheca rogersii TaxID=419775 RepID=UPI0022206ABB|nr:cytochrome c oxidase biogenesis protein Cmc1 like-domain-containing protein [Durotheca rogersii]KAI5864909.1 cytochrome c oxidase biogenesis protein Cmc1 like-domain-containing protein [Durotheca rogersii]